MATENGGVMLAGEIVNAAVPVGGGTRAAKAARVTGVLPQIGSSVTTHGGGIVGLVHEEFLAQFGNVAAAIECAIDLQQRLSASDKTRCGIGIAACSSNVSLGELTADASRRTRDPAIALSRAANGGAVLVAESAIETNKLGLSKLRTQFASAARISPLYRLPGLESDPSISFHEVIWSGRSEGLRMDAPAMLLESSTQGSASMQRGTVQRWVASKRHGFVISPNNEFFYFDDRYLVGRSELEPGDKVFFVPLPPLQEGKNRVAGAVIAAGARVKGPVRDLDLAAGHGFVDVADAVGNVQSVALYAVPHDAALEPGDLVSVVVEGARGWPVAMLDEEAA